MWILDKILGKKDNNKTDIDTRNNIIESSFNSLRIHEDLKNLLWVADGPQKNYAVKDSSQTFEYNGFRISFSSFSSQEPSLISTKLPIEEVCKSQEINRLPYYPTYAELTNEQRGVYWELLRNPYNGKLDIGYVFILYYGLERHLLEGDFEAAFNVILKLRDVYDNSSFQSYSACSVILTCLARKRADLVAVFFDSIDKNYEFNFSHNLYLFCKMGLNIPLTPSDIIRMSKTFEFSNQNYIKKYPDIFLKNMYEIMQARIGAKELDINKYVTTSRWRKLHKQAIPIFANMSIRDKAVEIPLISEDFKLKKIIYELLQETHEKVKSELTQMRKDNIIPDEDKSTKAKKIQILTFDATQEQELLKQYKKSNFNAMDKHFALIALQDFYYKYRDIDEKYLQICIDFCNEDILLLPQMQLHHLKEEEKYIYNLSSIYSKKEIADKLSAIETFKGNIPAFKRLFIIFEKRKEYRNSIEVCNKAIEYYKSVDMLNQANEFEQRKNKIESKV